MPELLSIEIAIFLCGTFAAAFVTSLSGFAFAMVAAAIWFYALTPPQASALIAAYALIVQGYAVWKLRRLLDWHRLMPFILGGALGIPLGVAVLRWASPILSSDRGGAAAGPFQSLQPGSAATTADEASRTRIGRCCRRSQRGDRRSYRARRDCHCYLDQHAWLVAR